MQRNNRPRFGLLNQRVGFDRMTQAELNSYSQRQLLRMYIERGNKPAIDKVLKKQRTPEESLVAAKAALDSGEWLGLPLDPRVS